MSTVTVLGATGGLGRAITLELAARGHDVTAASRTAPAQPPDGVRALAADLADPQAAATACAGSDVVVMAANVPYQHWETALSTFVDNALDGAAAAGARFVMVDNLYAYGSPGTPISESTPEAATTRKGAIRRRLGQRLLAAHGEGRARVAIGRLSDYYGPGGTNAMVYRLGVERALAGKPPRAFIDADQPHTFVYLPDAARAFATLVERAEADGQVWILPAAPTLTQRELLSMVAESAGVPPRIGRVSRRMLTMAGLVSSDLRELRELVQQWDRPYTTDASAFEQAFGPAETTAHDRAVAETVDSFRQRDGSS